ncbi:MAG TPA: acyl-CoA reductase [Bacteroidales bacterium]|nr:acyl-CoA reductase [Bacteroidales bacterium]
MNLKERIESFSKLGNILRDSLAGMKTKYSPELNRLIETQHQNNPWFTPDSVRMALKAIADELTNENVVKWTGIYPSLADDIKPVNVGVIMAGNIPLVGFHDFLSVLITGNNLIAKTSSKDSELIVFVSEILCDINSGFREKIKIAEGTLSGFDMVIATGSDNSSRYFEYYFGKYPCIIRKNRKSLAIIDGNETDEDLTALGSDVFSYFGLGCRNVSKLFIPTGYNFSRLVKAWDKYSGVINHSRYASNYDFSKAVYIVNKEKFTDAGFILLKENQGLSSPVAVLYYEYYNSIDEAEMITEDLKETIQCICSKNHISFGKAQAPALWDYADGIDTVEFLLKKNIAGIL